MRFNAFSCGLHTFLKQFVQLCRVFEGLKVTGGRMTQSGYLGAFITKVKHGSIADTMGRLKAGQFREICSSF